MSDRLNETIETYRQHFNKYIEGTVAEASGELRAWMDSFLSHLPSKGTILELGSAVGRDARYFAAKGYIVLCTDVIPQALEELAKSGFETAEYDFRNPPKPEWSERFDGYFANAVLLHAEQEDFEKALQNIAPVLKKGGIAAFSLKNGEGEAISTHKMDAPRYFRFHTEDEIRTLISKLPFEIISVTHLDEDKWIGVIMRCTK